jgi:hypothetical protein
VFRVFCPRSFYSLIIIIIIINIIIIIVITFSPWRKERECFSDEDSDDGLCCWCFYSRCFGENEEHDDEHHRRVLFFFERRRIRRKMFVIGEGPTPRTWPKDDDVWSFSFIIIEKKNERKKKKSTHNNNKERNTNDRWEFKSGESVRSVPGGSKRRTKIETSVQTTRFENASGYGREVGVRRGVSRGAKSLSDATVGNREPG